jgi:hypothetical protein
LQKLILFNIPKVIKEVFSNTYPVAKCSTRRTKNVAKRELLLTNQEIDLGSRLVAFLSPIRDVISLLSSENSWTLSLLLPTICALKKIQ